MDENFETGNIAEVADEPVNGNQVEPDEVAVDVDDTNYRLDSTPDKPEGFFVDNKITQGEDFDSDLYSSFQNISHTERLTQKQFAASVDFWNKSVRKYDVQGEEIRDAFGRFAKQQEFSRAQINGLEKWFGGVLEKSTAQLSLAKKIAAKAGVNRRSDSQAREIAHILSSRAYQNKGETTVERAAHKKAVSRMLVLCGARR